ncbi:MAG: glucosidase, partial [Planctomycetota bacterium]|nr:glucosidase [Planctomycetota bacterium]
GTVREDYSPDGAAWSYFPHDHAASRAYRWGEDGLLGICDRQCRLCFGVALWNMRDPILKERLFGLTGPEGNRGEDVKECYFYLDSSPTHSYMKALYKYPQAEFPYRWLVEEGRRRGREESPPKIVETGVFDDARYFDVFAEYAKAGPNDMLVRFTIANRGPDAAEICVLPTAWFRNTWIWGCRHEGCTLKPRIAKADVAGQSTVRTEHETLGAFSVAFGPHPGGGAPPELLFTENETNSERLFGIEQYTPYVKDAFHRYLIDGQRDAVNPDGHGTKAAALYRLTVPPGEQVTVSARIYNDEQTLDTAFGPAFDEIFSQRILETDAYYENVIPQGVNNAQWQVLRQAYAGLLWTKQFYHYIVKDWLRGDENVAAPPPERQQGRNRDWSHVYARDVVSMPDKWEYPWFAAWDLAFHMIPFARIDAEFAKHQLTLMLREWYMHPSGQLPAYEYDFGDVNPPVHAWACWRVYKMSAKRGQRDRKFLASVFQKLLLNFTWWVNRIDHNGDNVFAGGFLGLDNIGLFDRSKPLPGGQNLEQADGTAWMAFYCGTMLSMALELATEDSAYADMASKFFEHFVRITDAINSLDGTGLWDEEDGLYYDHLRADGRLVPMKVRSLVGLMPLIAVEVLDPGVVDQLPGFKRRLQWFLKYRRDLARHISFVERQDGESERFLLAIPNRDKLERVLRRLLDEDEFLSPYGIRSLSKYHAQHPAEFEVGGQRHRVTYAPGESDTWLFGGNSNWRGPIWFPINFLLIEALERFAEFYGDGLKVECPTGSGRMMNLRQVSKELNARLTSIFLRGASECRPCMSRLARYKRDPHWCDLVLFHEYFHAETGEGLGASHQTGWTALVVSCIEKMQERTATSTN